MAGMARLTIALEGYASASRDSLDEEGLFCILSNAPDRKMFLRFLLSFKWAERPFQPPVCGNSVGRSAETDAFANHGAQDLHIRVVPEKLQFFLRHGVAPGHSAYNWGSVQMFPASSRCSTSVPATPETRHGSI